jgi:hypothetical protein
MIFWKGQNCGDSKKITGCEGCVRRREGRMNRWSSETILYNILMVIIPLSKPTELATRRVKEP